MTEPMFYAEATSQAEEDAAFLAGATMVVRLDLLPGYVAPTPVPVPVTGASLQMTFDAAPFVDSSGHQHAVTMVGGPVSTDGWGDFRGVGKCATIADHESLRFGSGNFEISFDFKMPDSPPASTHIFLLSKGVAGNINQAWYLAILSGGYIGFIPGNNTEAIYLPYPYISDLTNPHNIKLRRTGSLTELLVDNTVIGSANDVAMYEGAGPLYIGGWNYGSSNTIGPMLDNLVINKP